MSGTFWGIWWNLSEFRDIRRNSGKLRGTQWNSVGFCMALQMNSVGIPGRFRGNAGFSGKIWGLGWFRPILGPQKANLRKSPQASPCQIPATDAWICCASPTIRAKRDTQHEFFETQALACLSKASMAIMANISGRLFPKWE